MIFRAGEKHKQRGNPMDKYFRAVGFSRLQAGKQLDALIQDSFRTCESKYATEKNSEDVYLDCFKYYGKGIGLGLSGILNKNKSVSLKKCFPFAESDCCIEAINVEIEDVDNDKLILFYDKKTLNQFVVKLQKPLKSTDRISSVSVSALSAKGKVLLPFYKDKAQEIHRKKESKALKKLFFLTTLPPSAHTPQNLMPTDGSPTMSEWLM